MTQEITSIQKYPVDINAGAPHHTRYHGDRTQATNTTVYYPHMALATRRMYVPQKYCMVLVLC